MTDRQERARRDIGGSAESIHLAITSLRTALKDIDGAKVPLAGAYTELAIFLCEEVLRRRSGEPPKE
ncbi:MAG TPA: hypothetical protein VF470_01250, partial [Sphingomicrobium sp.]